VATFAFIGDLIFGRRTSAAGPTSAPEHVWGDVLPYLRACDAVFANLESPITTTSRRWHRGWKAIRLHAAPSVMALLKAANVRFVNLANNHAMDCEVDGLLDTMNHLDAGGISHAGAGRNAAEAAKPAILEAAGIKIGVLSITDNMPEFAAGPTQPGTNYLRIHSDKTTLDYIGRQIDQLRAAGAKLVVLSAHWGPNLRQWPTMGFRQFAHAALDCGVDIVHGHSAHFVHGLDVHRNRVILYDTGDFLDDLWLFRFVPRYLSCVFLIDFDGGALQRVRVIPVILEPGRVRLGYGHRARRILARVLRRSPPGPGHRDTAAAELHLVPHEDAAQAAAPTGQEVLAIR
jgi:poly-gamma-glutamate capsule biosynthesis protein CapA/YwtB (metallophosphatase superfamily)